MNEQDRGLPEITIPEFIAKYNPCAEAVSFLYTQPSLAEAWEKCQSGNWMVWALDKIGFDWPPEAWRLYGAVEAEAWRLYQAAVAWPSRVNQAVEAEASRVYQAAEAEACRQALGNPFAEVPVREVAHA